MTVLASTRVAEKREVPSTVAHEKVRRIRAGELPGGMCLGGGGLFAALSESGPNFMAGRRRMGN